MDIADYAQMGFAFIGLLYVMNKTNEFLWNRYRPKEISHENANG